VRRALGLLAATGLALGALLLTAAPAGAHDKLESTTPKQGSSVATPPAQITLTFNQPAFRLGSRIRVVGPAGDVAAGEPVFRDRTVRQALRPDAPAGAYTVEWQVTSTDGHPIAGTWTFAVQQAGTAATTPAGATTPAADPTAAPTTVAAGAPQDAGDDDSGGSTGMIVGVTAVAAAVLLAAAAGVALTTRRRPQP
jgi:copper resistance protein C